MRPILPILILLLMTRCSKNQEIIPQPIKPAALSWELIWSDEFTTDGKPDATKWTFTSRGTSNWNCYCIADTTTAVVKSGKFYLKGRLSAMNNEKYKTGGVLSKSRFWLRYDNLKVNAILLKRLEI